jgi:hypothetical protein
MELSREEAVADVTAFGCPGKMRVGSHAAAA